MILSSLFAVWVKGNLRLEGRLGWGREEGGIKTIRNCKCSSAFAMRVKKGEPALGLRDAVEDLEVALAVVVAGEELALEEASVVDARVLVAAQRSALRVAHVLNAAHDCAENTPSISEQNYLIDCAENTASISEQNCLIDCAEPSTPSMNEQNYLTDCRKRKEKKSTKQ